MIKNNIPLSNIFYSTLETYELMDKGIDKQEAIKNILSKELFNNNLITVDKSKLN